MIIDNKNIMQQIYFIDYIVDNIIIPPFINFANQ
jgi:hypothetical protein